MLRLSHFSSCSFTSCLTSEPQQPFTNVSAHSHPTEVTFQRSPASSEIRVVVEVDVSQLVGRLFVKTTMFCSLLFGGIVFGDHSIVNCF